ncbi:unnamed protein product [Ectocarpus sp. 8 AP-2014]
MPSLQNTPSGEWGWLDCRKQTPTTHNPRAFRGDARVIYGAGYDNMDRFFAVSFKWFVLDAL